MSRAGGKGAAGAKREKKFQEEFSLFISRNSEPTTSNKQQATAHREIDALKLVSNEPIKVGAQELPSARY